MQSHLPGFIADYDKLKGKGVDVIACVSVNDVFVMAAWGKEHNADGKVPERELYSAHTIAGVCAVKRYLWGVQPPFLLLIELHHINHTHSKIELEPAVLRSTNMLAVFPKGYIVRVKWILNLRPMHNSGSIGVCIEHMAMRMNGSELKG